MTYPALARRLPDMRRNLRTLYRRHATRDEQQRGANWYPAARYIIREWSAHYDRSVDTIAAVIAALSPQCEWSRNLIAADDMLAGRPISVHGPLSANVRKAARILSESPTRYPTLADRMRAHFPEGPKVNAFACNLAGADDVPTIDTHAAQAALNDVSIDIIRGWQHYAVYAQAYQDVARSFGVTPSTFQATIWLVWRRLHPASSKRHARKLLREAE